MQGAAALLEFPPGDVCPCKGGTRMEATRGSDQAHNSWGGQGGPPDMELKYEDREGQGNRAWDAGIPGGHLKGFDQYPKTNGETMEYFKWGVGGQRDHI